MVKEWNSPLIFVLPHLFDYVVVAWDNIIADSNHTAIREQLWEY